MINMCVAIDPSVSKMISGLVGSIPTHLNFSHGKMRSVCPRGSHVVAGAARDFRQFDRSLR